MTYVFDPPKQPAVKITDGGLFPVRRIYCIGRNYADHVREMGGDPKERPPVFFLKPADAVAPDESVIPYASATDNLHYEGELVVALKQGGKNFSAQDARGAIFGYAAGCDLTRRDHQDRAKKTGSPWDTAKAFDLSAPLGDILPADKAGDIGEAHLKTTVNGETRQHAPLSHMIWPVENIITTLSEQFELKAGDLIFTGTPEGVGPLKRGDEVMIEAGPCRLRFQIGA